MMINKEQLEEALAKIYEAKIVNECIADMLVGRVEDDETVLEELRKKYGLPKD